MILIVNLYLVSVKAELNLIISLIHGFVHNISVNTYIQNILSNRTPGLEKVLLKTFFQAGLGFQLRWYCPAAYAPTIHAGWHFVRGVHPCRY